MHVVILMGRSRRVEDITAAPGGGGSGGGGGEVAVNGL